LKFENGATDFVEEVDLSVHDNLSLGLAVANRVVVSYELGTIENSLTMVDAS
jgi:hypothetical protein